MTRRKFLYSDIPLAERMLLKKYQTVKEHRDDAAKVALQIACVALNDTEGLGYQRLTKFAARVQELSKEYYEDTEVGDAHLEQRLSQLGFLVENGHIFSVENEEGKLINSKKLLEVSDERK